MCTSVCLWIKHQLAYILPAISACHYQVLMCVPFFKKKKGILTVLNLSLQIVIYHK